MAEQEPPDEVLTDYLEALRQVYREVATSIGVRVPDPKRAIEILDDFDRQGIALHNEKVTLMKAREIVRSNEQEPGSLAQLGKRHNRSKARIAQYLDIAKAAEEEQPCSSST
jgi:hypothetical protein